MSLQELKKQIYELSEHDRLALITTIVESLQKSSYEIPKMQTDRARAIDQMRGMLKTDQPAPTDAEVEAMLEERRMEKYL
jgi:hypothetical protein